MKYTYTGKLKRDGTPASGTIDAQNKDDAINSLADDGDDSVIVETIEGYEPLTLAQINAAYQSRNGPRFSSRAAAVALTRLFPCLADLYTLDFNVEDWTPQMLAATCRKLSTGEAECAKFVLLIYNFHVMTDPKTHAASKWKCGLFDLTEAATHWGSAEKAILIEWIKNPFFL